MQTFGRGCVEGGTRTWTPLNARRRMAIIIVEQCPYRLPCFTECRMSGEDKAKRKQALWKRERLSPPTCNACWEFVDNDLYSTRPVHRVYTWNGREILLSTYTSEDGITSCNVCTRAKKSIEPRGYISRQRQPRSHGLGIYWDLEAVDVHQTTLVDHGKIYSRRLVFTLTCWAQNGLLYPIFIYCWYTYTHLVYIFIYIYMYTNINRNSTVLFKQLVVRRVVSCWFYRWKREQEKEVLSRVRCTDRTQPHCSTRKLFFEFINRKPRKQRRCCTWNSGSAVWGTATALYEEQRQRWMRNNRDDCGSESFALRGYTKFTASRFKLWEEPRMVRGQPKGRVFPSDFCRSINWADHPREYFHSSLHQTLGIMFRAETISPTVCWTVALEHDNLTV